MPQQVKCPNIIRFDKERQQYVYCDHIFTVDGTNSGKVIECPTCGGDVRLGGIDLSRADTRIDEATLADVPDEDLLSPGTDLRQLPSVESPTADALVDDSELDDILAEPANLDGEFLQQADASNRFDGDLDDADFGEVGTLDEESALPNDVFDSPTEPSEGESVSSSLDVEPAESPMLPGPLPSFHGANLQMASYCPSCGAPLPAQQILCEKCGFHKKLQRRIRSGESHPAPDQPQLRGFQLWLKNNLAEGESIQGMLLLVGVLFVVLLIGLAVTTFIAYGLWAALFLPPLLLVIILMLNVVAAGDDNKTAGVARVVQNILWTTLLRFNRVTRWQLCSWPPGTTKILTRRDTQFADDDLLEAEGLDECQVIDLEGTSIRDAGLTYLTAFPQLRFIVLRNTSVSDEGVNRLQESLPAAWIWR